MLTMIFDLAAGFIVGAVSYAAFVRWIAIRQREDVATGAHNGFVIVALGTKPGAKAHYADTLPEAIALRRELAADGSEWRIYQRVPGRAWVCGQGYVHLLRPRTASPRNA